ncbi:hypothetical protein [Streptomyces sp. NPDC091371]|uniref:hypothetical protein n=1 Tax=Streptomyces sp. NPDC091371 TaxID=3155303 RepID=UPI00341EFBAC
MRARSGRALTPAGPVRRRAGAGAVLPERVQATRDARAADRTVTAWARDNAADLRRLAGRITAPTGLPAGAEGPSAT